MGYKKQLREEKQQAEARSAQMEAMLLQSLQGAPTYQTPEEALRFQELTAESAAGIRGYGQKIEDIASSRAGMTEAPGSAIQRENVRQMMESASRDIIEAGGSSAATLGAITQARTQEMGALRDIAVQGQQFKDQAQRDYTQALMQSAGLGAQATQIEGTGLQMMIGEKGKVYESELDKLRTMQQFQMTQLGNEQAKYQAALNAEAQRRAGNKQLIGDIAGGTIQGAGNLFTLGIGGK